MKETPKDLQDRLVKSYTDALDRACIMQSHGDISNSTLFIKGVMSYEGDNMMCLICDKDARIKLLEEALEFFMSCRQNGGWRISGGANQPINLVNALDKAKQALAKSRGDEWMGVDGRVWDLRALLL